MSSSDIAIRVQGLSKCYEIYANPRDRLKQFVLPRLQSLAGQPCKQYFREFWALKDVSFEIKKGETVAIIGSNGSGKSTLLQMICGTLSPTGGSVQTSGRIAALLELGSGFNPEFTGRENVYLNSAVIGLSREEIDQSFDAVAAFADIGDFIDQPVKTYSSGMMVRLAFSAAINVEPDILIVDEALAVGDGAFQLRCMTRLKAIQETGTTILFVSHDLSSIGRLCTSAHILECGGKLPTESVFDSIRTYERLLKIKDRPESKKTKGSRHPLKKIYLESEYFPDFLGTQEAVICEVNMSGSNDQEQEVFESGDSVNLSLRIFSEREFSSVIIGFGLRSPQGVRVIGGNSLYAGKTISLCQGENNFKISFILNIVANEYFLNFGLVSDDGKRTDLDQRWGVLKLVVTSTRLQVGVAYTPVDYSNS
ncbi:Teichoic acids export ATP-binding protein TagH [Betaproteobacteria bacterium MOLA814]|nr:Teichoic acids export ATP-binding protein TagH [Betaproteobacteria bacterium MOLA814]